MNCTDCSKQLVEDKRKRRKGTRCHPCATRAMARSPERRAQLSKAMKARMADPAIRAETLAKCHAGLRRRLEADPSLREQRRVAGERVGLTRLGNVNRPAGCPSRRAAAEKQSERVLGWCRPDYRDAYRQLVKGKGIRAAEARQMILDQIARDDAAAAARPAQRPPAPTFEEKLEAVRTGKATVTQRLAMPSRVHNFTLGGVSAGMLA